MSSYFAFLTNLPFYECTKLTVSARGYYSQGGEMYEITLLDLEQKPAMIEHFFS